MTNEQILSATGPELSQLLGKVLQTSPLMHEIRTKWAGDPPMKNPPTVCLKCGLIDPDVDGYCLPHAPIPLTPAEAFKWRDWAVEKYGEDMYWAALCEVFKSSQNPTSDSLPKFQWFVYGICRFKPEHYLKAAALCVLGDKTCLK